MRRVPRPSSSPSSSRPVGEAIRYCALSVAWSAVVGGASVGFGVVSGSLSLVGFGLDSLIDGSASAVLVRRFTVERHEPDRAAVMERSAVRFVGRALVLVAVYVAARSAQALADRSRPQHQLFGVALAAASVLVLPFLARSKLRLARELGSRALRVDAVLSAAWAVLA